MNDTSLSKKDQVLIWLLGSWVFMVSVGYSYYLHSPYRDTKFGLNGLFALLLIIPLMFRRPVAIPLWVWRSILFVFVAKLLLVFDWVHVGRGVKLMMEQLNLFAVLFVASMIQLPQKAFRVLQMILFATGLAVLGVAMSQESGVAFTSIMGKSGFFTSTFGQKNHFGQFLMLFGVFAWHRALFEKETWIARLGTLGAMTALWQLDVASSRSAMLATLVGMSLVTFMWFKSSPAVE